jgi:hypothetical protein
MFFLDSKNQFPLVYPYAKADFQPGLTSLNVEKDIFCGNFYHAWELFALDQRVVEDEVELRLLKARMMWVLTGREEFRSEMKAVAGHIGGSVLKEIMLKAKEGRAGRGKRFKKRFYKRPDRVKNKKRQAHSAEIVKSERSSFMEDAEVEMEERSEGEDSGAASDHDDPDI